jgi:lactam utilization protein B
MPYRPTTIERAFELAQSGTVYSVTELRLALKREGFADGRMHTDGHSVQRQLSALIAAATGRVAAPATRMARPSPVADGPQPNV